MDSETDGKVVKGILKVSIYKLSDINEELVCWPCKCQILLSNIVCSPKVHTSIVCWSKKKV